MPAPPCPRPPSARQAVWLLLRAVDKLTPAQQQEMRHRLLATAPDVQEALRLLEAFGAGSVTVTARR